MLTRGLTWNNIWDVYTKGVSTEESSLAKVPSDRVPGINALFSLPGSPVTIVDLFEKIQHLRAHYPIFERTDYSVVQIGNLTEQLLKRSKNVIQATWPELKAILSKTTNCVDPGERVDINHILDIYCSEDVSLKTKVILHMVQTQHHATQTPAFKNMAHSCENETLKQAWNVMRKKRWDMPINIAEFVSAFFPPGQEFTIPILEALTFIKLHPELIEYLRSDIRIYGAQHPEDDAFFVQARELLMAYPEALIELYAVMEKTISLDNFKKIIFNRSELTGRIQLKPLLEAYQNMTAHERDTPEAQMYFSDLFRNISVATENYENGHSNSLMETLVSENADGTIAKILAFHACCIGLFPDGRENEFKQLKVMFKHDPRTKAGHAAIIKKFIPDFKEWFPVVQSLGLNRSEIWGQGMQKMAGPPSDMSMTIEPNIFETIGL